MMRKSILLPLLAALAGVAGLFLRRWERAAAFQPETGLFTFGHPATLALLGLTLVVVVAVLAFCRGIRPVEGDGGYGVFLQPQRSARAALLAVSAALLVPAVLLNLSGLGAQYAALYQQSMWLDPAANPKLAALIGVIPRGLTALFSLVGFLCLLLLGRGYHNGTAKGKYNGLTLAPTALYCVFLITFYFEERGNPILADYGWGLLTLIVTLLGLYFAGSFSFQTPRPRLTAALSLVGLYGCVVMLGDGKPGYMLCLFLAGALMLTFHAAALLDPAPGET